MTNDPMDDQQLESYLKGFQPIPPDPLPNRRIRFITIAMAAAAAIFLGALLLPRFLEQPAPSTPSQSITVGSANAVLLTSSSWRQAMDDTGFAFEPAKPNNSPSTISAIDVLSQESLTQ